MKYIVASPEKVRLLHFGGGFRLVRDVAKEAGARAAINFGFFSMSKNHPKDSYPVGQVMVDGKNLVLSPAGIEHFHSVYRKDDGIKFWQWLPHGCDWGVRAGPRLVENGQICEWGIADPAWVKGGIRPASALPRVAIGIRADGQVVLAYWDAATIRQAAQDMLNLGCVEALAGDGGGSASWYDSQNLQHTVGQRLVPNCFIVEGDSSEQPQPEPRPSPGGEKNMIVCIDPGHGGPDPGALGRGCVREADVVLDISLHLGRYLKQAGIDVIFTRTTDVDLAPGNDDKEELQARCDVANNARADLFVSVHADAFTQSSVRGTRCYHYPTSVKGQAAARAIADSIRPMAQVAGASQNMATISSANYYVLKNTVMPAVLVETGFVTNETDLALLCEPGYRDKMGLAIALGIIDYFRS